MKNIKMVYHYHILGLKIGEDKLTRFASFKVEEAHLHLLTEYAEGLLDCYTDSVIEQYEIMYVVNAINLVAERVIFITPKNKLREWYENDEDFLSYLEEEGLTFEEGFENESVFWIDCVESEVACQYAELIGMDIDQYFKLNDELYSGRRERGIKS